MGRFERHLDLDLIERMRNGWRPHREVLPIKQQKPAREASSYRAARRNVAAKPWPGIETRPVWRPPLMPRKSERGEVYYQGGKRA